jgi:hypothetical protein
MVACAGAGGQLITFVVEGTLAVKKRHVAVWKGCSIPFHFDPSVGKKQEFAAVVRLKMETMGLTVFPYFIDAGIPNG